MIALDTNALVRLAARDDAAQLARVQALLAEQDALVLSSVLLETEWLLRARYQLQPAEIAVFFDYLATADGLEFENPAAALAAIAAYAQGLAFADALHAAIATSLGLSFATFDRKLQRKAKCIKNSEIRLL
jgi:predicted nucleic-acid-binding protein